MKRSLSILAVAAMASGCFTKIKTPSGASYINTGFTKTFSELEVRHGTNYVKVKGWKSDGAQAVDLAKEALKRVPAAAP